MESGQVADSGKVTSFLLSALRGEGPLKYTAAVDASSSELCSRGCVMEELSDAELDWVIGEKIVDLYEESEGTCAGMAQGPLLIAAVSKMRPQFRFKVSWKALDVWRVKCPAQQAPAFTPEMALGVGIRVMVAHGRPAAGVANIICFVALLRASEALKLVKRDLLDLGSYFVVVINIAKRGLEQKAIVSNPRMVLFLRGFMNWSALLGPEDRLFDFSYNTMQYWLKKVTNELGFPRNWTSHGLRRGGATELMRNNIPLASIAVMGRWLSERSMREYLRRGEVAQLRLRRDNCTPVLG